MEELVSYTSLPRSPSPNWETGQLEKKEKACVLNGKPLLLSLKGEGQVTRR